MLESISMVQGFRKTRLMMTKMKVSDVQQIMKSLAGKRTLIIKSFQRDKRGLQWLFSAHISVVQDCLSIEARPPANSIGRHAVCFCKLDLL